MIDWTLLGMTLAILLVGIWYACTSGGSDEDVAQPPDSQANPTSSSAESAKHDADNSSDSMLRVTQHA
jgi:hypothetical protein